MPCSPPPRVGPRILGLIAHTGSVRSASLHTGCALRLSSVKVPQCRWPVSVGYAVRPQRIGAVSFGAIAFGAIGCTAARDLPTVWYGPLRDSATAADPMVEKTIPTWEEDL